MPFNKVNWNKPIPSQIQHNMGLRHLYFILHHSHLVCLLPRVPSFFIITESVVSNLSPFSIWQLYKFTYVMVQQKQSSLACFHETSWFVPCEPYGDLVTTRCIYCSFYQFTLEISYDLHVLHIGKINVSHILAMLTVANKKCRFAFK